MGEWKIKCLFRYCSTRRKCTRIKSIVAVLLAASVILLGEPLMVNASSTSNIVVNELAEAQEADAVNTVELSEVIEISDDSISEEELQSI